MKIVPVIRVSDLDRSIRFYIDILGFAWRWPEWEAHERANGVADLVLEGEELQLSIHAGDGKFGNIVRIRVDDVDACYRLFKSRGLDTTQHPESPVHTAPVDQTWGLREYAAKDPDGNGLLYCAPIR